MDYDFKAGMEFLKKKKIARSQKDLAAMLGMSPATISDFAQQWLFPVKLLDRLEERCEMFSQNLRQEFEENVAAFDIAKVPLDMATIRDEFQFFRKEAVDVSKFKGLSTISEFSDEIGFKKKFIGNKMPEEKAPSAFLFTNLFADFSPEIKILDIVLCYKIDSFIGAAYYVVQCDYKLKLKKVLERGSDLFMFEKSNDRGEIISKENFKERVLGRAVVKISDIDKVEDTYSD